MTTYPKSSHEHPLPLNNSLPKIKQTVHLRECFFICKSRHPTKKVMRLAPKQGRIIQGNKIMIPAGGQMVSNGNGIVSVSFYLSLNQIWTWHTSLNKLILLALSVLNLAKTDSTLIDIISYACDNFVNNTNFNDIELSRR